MSAVGAEGSANHTRGPERNRAEPAARDHRRPEHARHAVCVPFNVTCGECRHCKRELWPLCSVSNRKVKRYNDLLLKKIEAGEIDPSFIITHTPNLDEAPEMYKTFRDKKDGCIKVVLKP